MANNYKRYQVLLRIEDDADLIDWIESHKESVGTTDLFRRGIEKLKSEGL